MLGLNHIGRTRCSFLQQAALLIVFFAAHSHNSLAQNPNSDTTTSGQILTVNITSPAEGSLFQGPPPCQVSVEGLVTLSEVPDTAINVLYVIDLSGSTSEFGIVPLNIPPIDVNADGVVDEKDDFNGDGFSGDILDAEIGAALALNLSIGDLDEVDVGIIAYASNASIADVSPQPGPQIFTSSPLADQQPNSIPDIEEVLRSLDSDSFRGGSIGLFTPVSETLLGSSTNFEAALRTIIASFETQPQGEKNVAFFLSDGFRTSGGTIDDEIALAAAKGIVINTIGITQFSDAEELSAIAEGTGGTFIRVIDPNDLVADIIKITPVKIAGFTVNGVPVSLSAAGTFLTSMSLHAGSNTISATATADDSTRVTATISVTCQAEAFTCQVDIISPQDSAVVCGDSVNVVAVTSVSGGIPPITSECTINGLPVQPVDDTLSATIPLEAGVNLIVVVCAFTDAQNNQIVCSDTVQVKRAELPVCQVEITSPQDSAVVCSDSVKVTAVTKITGGTPPLTITYDINGVVASLVDSMFIATVPLPSDENLIIATCTIIDSCGSETVCEDSIRVFRPAAPSCAVEITSPQDSAVVCSDSVKVTAVTKITGGAPPLAITYDINGVVASLIDSMFMATVPLPSDENLIIATCTIIDSCGSEIVCQDSIRVFRPAAPGCLVEITSPEEGATITGDSVTVKGFFSVTGGSPPFTITCDVNGVMASLSDTMFMATVPCSPGENALVATCTVVDSCGRQTTCQDTVHVECRPEQEGILFGVDGDDDFLVKVDISAGVPPVEILGTVVNGSKAIVDMEAMTWDPVSGRILVVSNEGRGPLYMIDPNDITGPPPADIPATFIGNTESDDIEGMAVHPASGELFGVDNTSHKLLRISKTNGAVTEVGNLGFKDVEGLAFTLEPEPVLYGADTKSGKLITINTSTGAGTPVHPDSTIGFPNVECLAFAPDGTLFGFSNSVTDVFITIDLASGIGSEFPTLGSNGLDIEGLTFLKPDSLLTTGDPLTTSVETEEASTLPKSFGLEQNYPNPFNPTTTIRFNIPEYMTHGVQVQLRIYNLLGALIRTLVDEKKLPGQYIAVWDGRNKDGEMVSSGIYLYQMVAGDFRQTKRLLLLK